MQKMKLRNRAGLGVITVVLLALSGQVLAGPPLICHPLDIGAARSLPWAGAEWRAVSKDYDLNRLVADTLELLGPETPLVVRMETLRRATVYARWARLDHEVGYTVKDDRVAQELMARLAARAQEAERRGLKTQADALSLFDAGYLVECYRQTTQHSDFKSLPPYDGYAWVSRASQALGRHAEAEFALALMLLDKPARKAEREAHFKHALGGAKEGSLLARNLVRHFSDRGRTLGELRASAAKSGY
jgi:hypothetical protein